MIFYRSLAAAWRNEMKWNEFFIEMIDFSNQIISNKQLTTNNELVEMRGQTKKYMCHEGWKIALTE